MINIIFSKKKGIEELQWTFISILIALLFVTFALSPLQKSVEEAARNSERLVAQELVTAINLAQSSPDTTDYRAFVPARGRDECTIEAKNGILKITFVDDGKTNAVFAPYLVTNNDVVVKSANNRLDCKKEQIIIKKIIENGKAKVVIE